MRYDHFLMLPEKAFQPRNGRFGMTLEGKGGGGTPPAPDPNIGIAQREMADISREYLEQFKTEIWPKMKEESEQLSARADEQWAVAKDIQTRQLGIAEEEYARRRDVFRPIEDVQISEAMAAGSAADQERQAALALGDVRTATARAQQDLALQQRAFGIDPTAGRYQGMMRAAGVDTAAVEAAAATRARQAADQLGWAKRMDALALGQGQFGNQATSTGLSLNAGGQQMQAAAIPLSAIQAQQASMQSGYALPMQGWQNVGQLGVAKYNADVNAYSAQQQAESQNAAGLGSMFGTLGGALIKNPTALGTLFSDIRMKENVIAVGKMDNGLTVYEFEYKPEFKDIAGHGRYRGVMADEVEHVIPEAVLYMPNGYKAVNYEMVI